MGAAAAAAAVTAVGTIGAAAINSSGKSNSSSTSGTTDTSHTPWAPQGAAIQSGLGAAQGVYADRSAQGPYAGALYAGQNGTQKSAQDFATGYANGEGQYGANRAFTIGGQADNALGTATGASTGVATNGIGQQNGALMGALQGYGTGQTAAVNPNLSGALASSATAGARSIGGFNAGLSGVMDAATADPTQKLAGDAATYMNSGATQKMVDNVNGQIDTTLNESTVPGLNRQAEMGGNLNSSRAGMAEAMANRDAALAKGNADAQIENNSFNTGLGVASAQHTTGLNTAASAASAGLTGNSNLALGTGNQNINAAQTAIGAANSGLSQQTSHQTADASARLGAAGQLATDANTALNATTTSANLANTTSGMLSTAGQMQQNDEQQKLNENYAKWQLQNQYQQGVLSDYMKTVTMPSGYYDSNTSSKTTSTPPSSIGTLLAGGATAIGSQFAKGGILNSKNADGSTNSGYIGNWFGNSNGGTTDVSSRPDIQYSPSYISGVTNADGSYPVY